MDNKKIIFLVLAVVPLLWGCGFKGSYQITAPESEEWEEGLNPVMMSGVYIADYYRFNDTRKNIAPGKWISIIIIQPKTDIRQTFNQVKVCPLIKRSKFEKWMRNPRKGSKHFLKKVFLKGWTGKMGMPGPEYQDSLYQIQGDSLILEQVITAYPYEIEFLVDKQLGEKKIFQFFTFSGEELYPMCEYGWECYYNERIKNTVVFTNIDLGNGEQFEIWEEYYRSEYFSDSTINDWFRWFPPKEPQNFWDHPWMFPDN